MTARDMNKMAKTELNVHYQPLNVITLSHTKAITLMIDLISNLYIVDETMEM